MSRKKKSEAAPVVASNFEDTPAAVSESSDNVIIACHLPLGLVFDDVPNGMGGTKKVEFPGLNASLRGNARGGILLGAGKAVAVSIARKDWEAIKAMHGKEPVFRGVGGNPPCLIEMQSIEEFNARRDEIVSEMKHGLEPIDPAAVRVKAADSD